MPDWETTTGVAKTLSGYARGSVLSLPLTGWHTPKIVMRSRATGTTAQLDCQFDVNTGRFDYTLPGDQAAGGYDIQFSALDGAGDLHLFPETTSKHLHVYPAL